MKEEILLKAMLVIEHDGKLLVSGGYDKVKDEHFYELLGGSVNFGETSEEGIRREMREELGSEIESLKLFDVVESIFEYNGNKGHQICFIYTGELADKSLFEKEKIHIVEETYEGDAVWVPLKKLWDEKIPLYPESHYEGLLKGK